MTRGSRFDGAGVTIGRVYRPGKGQQIFVDELAQFAAGVEDSRVRAIARRAGRSVRVAVRGRPGVGCRTVARGLQGALDDVDISSEAAEAAGAAGAAEAGEAAEAAEVDVYVAVEVLKPEDRDAMAARPAVLVVLNKADLLGFGGDGPLAAARDRCVALSRFPGLIGVPVEPMVGLLAAAALDGLDDDGWAGLWALAAHPAAQECLELGFAGFLAADLPVTPQLRMRLLGSLDLFGVALVVAAMRRGGSQAQVRTLLRRVSGVDVVLARLEAACAEVRYRRVLEAVAQLEALAASAPPAGPAISDFLRSDDTVLARMAVAMDAVLTSRLPPGPGESLARAVHWQRYSQESVNGVHQACGTDITRGSLRLWHLTAGSGPGSASGRQGKTGEEW